MMFAAINWLLIISICTCKFQVYTGMDYLEGGGSFISSQKSIIGFFNNYSDSQEYTMEEVVLFCFVDKKKTAAGALG